MRGSKMCDGPSEQLGVKWNRVDCPVCGERAVLVRGDGRLRQHFDHTTALAERTADEAVKR